MPHWDNQKRERIKVKEWTRIRHWRPSRPQHVNISLNALKPSRQLGDKSAEHRVIRDRFAAIKTFLSLCLPHSTVTSCTAHNLNCHCCPWSGEISISERQDGLRWGGGSSDFLMTFVNIRGQFEMKPCRSIWGRYHWMLLNAICGDLFLHWVTDLAADSDKTSSLCNQLMNSILSSYFFFSFLSSSFNIAFRHKGGKTEQRAASWNEVKEQESKKAREAGRGEKVCVFRCVCVCVWCLEIFVLSKHRRNGCFAFDFAASVIAPCSRSDFCLLALFKKWTEQREDRRRGPSGHYIIPNHGLFLKNEDWSLGLSCLKGHFTNKSKWRRRNDFPGIYSLYWASISMNGVAKQGLGSYLKG